MRTVVIFINFCFLLFGFGNSIYTERNPDQSKLSYTQTQSGSKVTNFTDKSETLIFIDETDTDSEEEFHGNEFKRDGKGKVFTGKSKTSNQFFVQYTKAFFYPITFSNSRITQANWANSESNYLVNGILRI